MGKNQGNSSDQNSSAGGGSSGGAGSSAGGGSSGNGSSDNGQSGSGGNGESSGSGGNGSSGGGAFIIWIILIIVLFGLGFYIYKKVKKSYTEGAKALANGGGGAPAGGAPGGMPAKGGMPAGGAGGLARLTPQGRALTAFQTYQSYQASKPPQQ